MAKTFTVARARQQFANLIASAERGGVVEITRRGKPVAVVISAAQYAGLSGASRPFVVAVSELRDRLGVADLEIDDQTFAGLRDRSSGREVSL